PSVVYGEQPAWAGPGIRASIAQVHFGADPRGEWLASAASARANRPAQKATAAFALGFLGLLGGAWIGAKLEADCRCDDPGLKGAMIGAPIGAALGGILGWRLAR